MADTIQLYLGGLVTVGAGRELASGERTVLLELHSPAGDFHSETLTQREAFQLAQLLCSRLPGLEPHRPNGAG